MKKVRASKPKGAYGSYTAYPKVNLYFKGTFLASTNWAHSCAFAVKVYLQANGLVPAKFITARYADNI